MKELFNEEKYCIYVEKQNVPGTEIITNTYFIQEKMSNKVLVVDPAYDAEKILDNIHSLGAKIDSIILTHAHLDHMGALYGLLSETKVKAYVHVDDYNNLTNETYSEARLLGLPLPILSNDMLENIITVQDGDKFNVGELQFSIVHTPGHTKGSICVDILNTNVLITGDTVFENSYGRTDLTCGNINDMKNSLKIIFEAYKEKIILPGHGSIASISSAKRRVNLLLALRGE